MSEKYYSCDAFNVCNSDVIIAFTAKKKLPKPSIQWGINQHFVSGDNFTLECILIDHESVAFSWSYPNTASVSIYLHSFFIVE